MKAIHRTGRNEQKLEIGSRWSRFGLTVLLLLYRWTLLTRYIAVTVSAPIHLSKRQTGIHKGLLCTRMQGFDSEGISIPSGAS